MLSLKCFGKELYSTLLKISSANDTCDELEVEGRGEGHHINSFREKYWIWSISQNTSSLTAKSPGESSITLSSASWF